ncbi:hypothetical protein OJAV_G00175990 [Oryzias javanicus]|uniref:Uncharacterized protein n=1 Tax=Oryzias javanicus TaxID=123683 RepID=A0A3S2U3I7_ORYJA|nr:hypothetical protein OJAV_G00175990 [Oryzias javanicus]
MLFLSRGTEAVTPKCAGGGQKHQGNTVHHISGLPKQTQRDASLSEPKMGRDLVENCHLKKEVMNLVPMENSPRQGRARHELSRWPSLSGAERQGEEAVVERAEEELKMKTDRFLNQPSKYSGNSAQHTEMWQR